MFNLLKNGVTGNFARLGAIAENATLRAPVGTALLGANPESEAMSKENNPFERKDFFGQVMEEYSEARTYLRGRSFAAWLKPLS
jgi:hypothetical protein